MREAAPVIYSPTLKGYLVTRYEDAVQVFKDRDTFLAAPATAPFSPVAPEAQAVLNASYPRTPTLANADPPRHPPMRHAASLCLSRRRWEQARPSLTAHAESAMEQLLKKPEADLFADLIAPLTKVGGFKLIGFPLEDINTMKAWATKRVLFQFGVLSVEDQVEAAHSLIEFWNYCRDFVALRVGERGDDLTSDLLGLVDKGVDNLQVDDVTNMIYGFVLATFESTASAMMNGIRRLLREPEAWAALCSDPTLIPNAVEELLRAEGPLLTHRRVTSRDTNIAGVPIPAGSLIMMLIAAANHDPRQFTQPERLIFDRAKLTEHLAFGKYWHSCLGAPLAKMIYEIVLSQLTARAPRMRLVEDQGVEYLPVLHLRIPSRLLVEPAPAQSAVLAV
jgi:cytochrome P450